MKIFIIILFISVTAGLFSAFQAYGQVPGQSGQTGQTYGQTYGQDTTTRHDTAHIYMRARIIAYQFKPDFTSLDSIEIDTTLKRFQLYYKPISDRSLDVYLGNLSLPYESSIFSNRATNYSDFLFSHFIEYDFHQPDRLIYHKTWSPFTELTYFTSGPKSRQEQSLNIIHTQNITKNLNVGFLGDLDYSDGQFANQRTRVSSFTLYSGYGGSRYSVYGSASLNTYKAQENGGIRSDTSYTLGNVEISNIPVNLQNANTVIKRQSVFLFQRLYLTGSFKEDSLQRSSKWNEVVSVIHRLQYDRYERGFTDDLKTASLTTGEVDSLFFANRPVNFNGNTTNDSLYFRRLENTVELAINANQWLKIPAELRFGIKNQIDKFKYGPQDTLSIKNGNSVVYHNQYLNTALVGSLADRFSKTVNWGASVEIYLPGTGYKRGDFDLQGDIEKSIKGNFIMKLTGRIALTTPGYFVKQYESNHFSWFNDFSPQKTSTVHLSLYHKKIKFSLDAQIDAFDNYVYFDENAMPAIAKYFTVQSLTLNKLFGWGIFHTDFRLTAQKSINETAVAIPAFSGFNSTYLQFLFFKVLHVQFGGDLFYNSAFYADSYMPETGLFYSQKAIKIGKYPYTDMFLNIKLKRFRFFLKYERVNTFFPNSTGFYLPHYPYNPSLLKYGLSWTFYD